MCGIAGILSTTAPVSPDEIEAMTSAMAHRGPDDAGAWVRGQAGLGHRRLSILDLSPLGHQPMWSADGRRVIVFNGEIYNFERIGSDLVRAGHRFRSRCDTEVILAAYEEYGTGCLERLRGMFSLAIWDDNDRTLFVARDRLGKKPLYYYADGTRFAFASELGALLRLPWLPSDLDLHAVSSYFALQYVPGPRTIYRHVRKLQPGHFLTVREFGARHRIERYWRPGCGGGTDTDPIRTLGGLLEESVALRLIADVPVGVLLSGGLDSSLITALAARQSPRRVQTFSVTFPHKKLDESSYAELVARHAGTDHHAISADEATPDVLCAVVEHLDEPLADPAAVPTYVIARLAARHVKVVLTGEGADELFGGYRHYRWERLAAPALGLPPGVRRAAARLLVRSSGQRSLTDRIIKVLDSRTEASVARWVTVFGADDRRRCFSREFQVVTDGVDPLAPIYDIVGGSDSDDGRGRALALDLQSWLPDDLLMKVDKMSMANSLEARAPYLDQVLVEYVLSCRPTLKFSAFRSKILLKRLGLRYLPPEIVNRRKHGFEVPVASWLLGNFRDLAEECFRISVLKEIGLFEPDAVRAEWTRLTSGDPSASPRRLWTLFSFIQWHRQCFSAAWRASAVPAAASP
jgi:asparagine synthase (glutamine-hydrolysing)